MARYFVTNDDQTVRVEVTLDPAMDENSEEETYLAVCEHGPLVDILAGTREAHYFQMAIEGAARHADHCTCRERN